MANYYLTYSTSIPLPCKRCVTPTCDYERRKKTQRGSNRMNNTPSSAAGPQIASSRCLSPRSTRVQQPSPSRGEPPTLPLPGGGLRGPGEAPGGGGQGPIPPGPRSPVRPRSPRVEPAGGGARAVGSGQQRHGTGTGTSTGTSTGPGPVAAARDRAPEYGSSGK